MNTCGFCKHPCDRDLCEDVIACWDRKLAAKETK